VLRDKGLEEEELVPWEGEFICCVCATTAVVVIIPLNVHVVIIIAAAKRIAVVTADRFLIR
jgi:hypothetical protein